MENKPQHIQVPNDMCKEHNLDPTDVYVYSYLKTYMNKDPYEAFPSMETLAKDAGVSKTTVNKAIKNLVANGDISVRKEGRKNVYKFNPSSKNFEMFTYKFMRDVDLTYSNQELSEEIGLSASTIYRRNKELEDKGILQVIDTDKKDPETGVAIQLKLFDLSKIAQDVLFIKKKLEEHDKEIKENSKTIKLLSKEVEELRAEIKKLKGDTELKMIMD